jgi:SAM-dependent methyltransferase
MRLSNTLSKRSPLLGNLYCDARRACLVKSWEFSGTAVARYYSNLLLQFGASPQALDERSDLKEHLFYDHLFNGVVLAPTLSVLDIGCGMGNLIEYIQGRGVQISDYQGIDLVQHFVDVCREKYGRPFVFHQANFVSDSFLPAQSFDLVVNMGVLVSRVLLYEQYIEYSIKKMIQLSNKYVLFNVITDVDSSLGNYKGRKRIGQITHIPRSRLFAILDAATRDLGAHYELHEVNIYPDATDAFVRITVHNAG